MKNADPVAAASPLFTPAGPEDVVRVGHMLRSFYRSRAQAYGIPYDHSSCLETILDCVERGIVLVGPGSCAGALVIPFPYNRSALVANVVFWYVENKREIGIFDVLLGCCRHAGATHINASTLAPKHVGKRFYTARGMTLAEYQFIGPTSEKPCTPGGKD